MKKYSIFIAVFIAVYTFACASFSEDIEKVTKDIAKATVNYPANLLNETVNVVGEAVNNTAGVVGETVKVTGETLSGDFEKAPQIVSTPFKKSAKTIKAAVDGAVEAPVKAGEKTSDQNN